MSPAIPENERGGAGQTTLSTARGSHGEEMMCPCCHQPALTRVIVVECSSCGFRKVEPEADMTVSPSDLMGL
ncbi:MAG: hypothetical protein ACM3VT_00420 [Solirubrobacterales bacterium]